MRTRLLFLITSLLLLVGCDHATKHWAKSTLEAAPPVQVVRGVLDLRYSANDDMAFSLLRDVPVDSKRPWFLVVGALGIAALGATWLRRRRAPAGEQLAYVMLLAGALGNVGDRLFRGYVVDFIHLHRWPIFNVADALLVGGMLLYALMRVRPPPDELTATSSRSR
jgi:signal peptidase II